MLLNPAIQRQTGQVLKESVGIRQTIEAVMASVVGARSAAAGIDEIKEDQRYFYGTGYASMIQGISNGAEGIDVVGASVQMSQDGSVLIGAGAYRAGSGAANRTGPDSGRSPGFAA